MFVDNHENMMHYGLRLELATRLSSFIATYMQYIDVQSHFLGLPKLAEGIWSLPQKTTLRDLRSPL